MNEKQAATRADEIVDLLITHQSKLFSDNLMQGVSGPKTMATALASLRLQLMEELKKHPD